MNWLKQLYLLEERRNQSLIILLALSLLLGILLVSGIHRAATAQESHLLYQLHGDGMNNGKSASHARDVFVGTEPKTGVAQDCLIYNPLNLAIVDEGANGWLLTDGVSRMHMFDNVEDAVQGWILALRHTGHCFIGRGNSRPNRGDYIVEYWSGASGVELPISNEDCISYNRHGLRIVNEGANGWLLTDGNSRMLMLDNKEDAERALGMASENSKQCFIGRNNIRPNRKTYIFGYWQ